MSLWKLIARQIRSRLGRTILTLLSIVIGVAAVVSVRITTTTTRRAYQDMFSAAAGRATLEVVAAGGGGFDAKLVGKLERLPQVKLARPVIQKPTLLYFQGKRVKLLSLGVEGGKPGVARDYPLESGVLFENGKGAVIAGSLARNLGIRLNDEVRLLARKGLRRMPVVGLLADDGAAALSHGTLVLLPLGEAQRLFGARGQVDSIQLELVENADEAGVRDALAGMLPMGLLVQTPASRNQLGKEMVLATEQALTFDCAVSIVVAMLMILNTFQMNLGERRRQIAILRAVGATSEQIVRLILLEGLLLGVLGTLIGIGVGVGGAVLLSGAMERLFQASFPPFTQADVPLVLAGVLGPGISLLAAYLPARAAGRTLPVTDLKGAARDRVASVWVYAACGAVALLLSGVVIAGCTQGWLSGDLAIPACVAGMLACLLLIPISIGPLSRLVYHLLRPLFRAEGRLAHGQVLRRRSRTALTVATLFVAISTGVAMGNNILDNVEDVRNWLRRTIVGDFFVRAMIPDTATGLAADMPETLGAEIAAIEGVGNIDTMRFVSAKAEGQGVIVIVREFTSERLPVDLKQGDAADARRGLFAGEVIIGTVLAHRTGLGLGDQITLETRAGAQQLRIAGTTTEYTVGGMTLYMERSAAKRLLAVEGVDAFLIEADPGKLVSVEASLRALCEEHGLLLESFADLSAKIEGMMAGVLGSLWVLLALGFLVAAFGIANTLTMNVLEQTREIGLLRSIGMTREQIRKMILAQAAILGVVGLGPGVLVGLLTAYLLNWTLLPLRGQAVEFAIHPVLAAGCLAAALGVVLIAAYWPAERAARLELLEALRYE